MSLVPNFHYKSEFAKLLGNSEQAKYLVEYLDELEAETCISEKYIDKDYLIDYQKFYSRSFIEYERFTERLHFFSGKFDSKDFDKFLEFGDFDSLKKILGSYLGFVVKKPVPDYFNHPLIGRTLLKTYPEKDKTNNNRHFVTIENHASLFGIELKIDSIPFQMQDQRVSACATIALWTTLHALSRLFEIPNYSPAEITEVSTSHISRYRNFPQGGLTLGQMFKCIRSMDLDIEVIKWDPKDQEFIPYAIKAYLMAGIPLIAHLRFCRPKKSDVYHAVVITGYKCDKNHKMIEIYIHDDGIGPYSRVKPDSTFQKWNNEWINRGYTVFLEEVFVPLYSKIRLQFKWAYFYHLEKLKQIKRLKAKDKLTVELFLTTVQDYKKHLVKSRIFSKLEKIKKLFPKYLWIERVYYKDRIFMDWIFDGTATYPLEIEQSPIFYKPPE